MNQQARNNQHNQHNQQASMMTFNIFGLNTAPTAPTPPTTTTAPIMKRPAAHKLTRWKVPNSRKWKVAKGRMTNEEITNRVEDRQQARNDLVGAAGKLRDTVYSTEGPPEDIETFVGLDRPPVKEMSRYLDTDRSILPGLVPNPSAAPPRAPPEPVTTTIEHVAATVTYGDEELDFMLGLINPHDSDEDMDDEQQHEQQHEPDMFDCCDPAGIAGALDVEQNPYALTSDELVKQRREQGLREQRVREAAELEAQRVREARNKEQLSTTIKNHIREHGYYIHPRDNGTCAPNVPDVKTTLVDVIDQNNLPVVVANLPLISIIRMQSICKDLTNLVRACNFTLPSFRLHSYQTHVPDDNRKHPIRHVSAGQTHIGSTSVPVWLIAHGRIDNTYSPMGVTFGYFDPCANPSTESRLGPDTTKLIKHVDQQTCNTFLSERFLYHRSEFAWMEKHPANQHPAVEIPAGDFVKDDRRSQFVAAHADTVARNLCSNILPGCYNEVPVTASFESVSVDVDVVRYQAGKDAYSMQQVVGRKKTGADVLMMTLNDKTHTIDDYAIDAIPSLDLSGGERTCYEKSMPIRFDVRINQNNLPTNYRHTKDLLCYRYKIKCASHCGSGSLIYTFCSEPFMYYSSSKSALESCANVAVEDRKNDNRVSGHKGRLTTADNDLKAAVRTKNSIYDTVNPELSEEMVQLRKRKADCHVREASVARRAKYETYNNEKADHKRGVQSGHTPHSSRDACICDGWVNISSMYNFVNGS